MMQVNRDNKASVAIVAATKVAVAVTRNETAKWVNADSAKHINEDIESFDEESINHKQQNVTYHCKISFSI